MKKWKCLAVSSLILTMGVSTALAQEAEKKDRDRGDRRARMREMMKDDDAPKPGDVAPTFKLKSLDGKQEFDLAGFKGKRPVVLFFGSYT